ncbi:MAG: hypothetical protein GY909_18705 [Oligoflexia bacterium]|nr:hypothetical protein [Oligoflexia bacterium]
MSSRQEKIDSLVLQVLSFYEPMSFEKILLDMPDDRIAEIEDFNREDLDKALEKLVKKKLAKLSYGEKKEKFWLRQIPKRSIFSRMKDKLMELLD